MGLLDNYVSEEEQPKQAQAAQAPVKRSALDNYGTAQAQTDDQFRSQFDEQGKVTPDFWSRESWDKASKMLGEEMNKPENITGAMNNAAGMLGPAMAAKLPDKLQSFLGKMFTQGAQGAAMAGPENRGTGFMLGAGSQGVLGAGEKLMNGVRGGVKTVTQARGDARNPGQLENAAQDAINEAAHKLPEAEAQHVYAALRDKNFSLNPRSYMGISPEADAILEKYRAFQPSQVTDVNGVPRMIERTAETQVSGADAYNLRKAISSEVRRRNTPGVLVDAPTATANSAAAAKESELRGLIRTGGGDVVDSISGLQDAVQDSQALQRGGKFDPVGFFDDPKLGRAGLLENTDKTIGTNLTGMSKRVSAASDMHKHPYKSVPKVFIKGASDGLDKPVSTQPAAALDTFILNLMNRNRTEKQ